MMIRTLMATVVMFASLNSFAAGLNKVYGIHLFFNEQEFVDVLTLIPDDIGGVQGHMDVPNDFAGKVDNLVVTDETITFDLFVPKNASRPKDLIFHYRGNFFDASQKQIIGYVTLKDGNDFVASFTGFLREDERVIREN